MVDGVANSVDAATANPVAAIVLRGAGDTLTAGYDLNADYSGTLPPEEWTTPYGGPREVPRDGAWDPVSDYQFMQHNVRRFMRLWECPKPVLAEVKGWAVGGATDLILCADQLYMASDAHIGYAPSRVYGVPTTMMWVHRLGLEHAKQFLLTGRAIDAATAHRIGLVAHVCEPAGTGRDYRSGREAIYTHTCQSACTQQDVDQPGVRKHGSAQFADVRDSIGWHRSPYARSA